MKKTSKTARIGALILAIFLVLTFILPAFAMLVGAEESGAFVVAYDVKDGNKNPVMLEKDKPAIITFTVSDPRITENDSNDIKVKANLEPGSFASGAIDFDIKSASSTGVTYELKFNNVYYDGINPDFKFTVSYEHNDGTPYAVALQTISHTITKIAPTATPTPEPTPVPTQTPVQNVVVDSTKPVYIQSYKVMDINNKEMTKVNPGDYARIQLRVVDERVTYVPGTKIDIRARMAQGAFVHNISTDVYYGMEDIGSVDGRKILAYTVTFVNTNYQGGTPDVSFDVTYTTKSNTPVPVPYTLLTQNITQAVDDVPEPKIILNSANYGGAAYIDKPFTLATVATNTSEYVDLENVSVRAELPAGISMAEGNSQVLIGEVAKQGMVKHNFRLMVTGVESGVTTLPVKLVYEFDAYVKGERKTYTSEQEVAINIEQETKFEISKLDYMESINQGEEAYMGVYLINKGKTAVNNVTAEIQCDLVNGPQTVFVGNIAPGTEGNADIYFTPTEMGTATGKVIITYEDVKGKQYTIEKEFTTEVLEPYVWEGPMVDMPMEEPVEEGTPIYVWVILIVLVAGVAGAVVFIKKRKAKKAAEDEDEDI